MISNKLIPAILVMAGVTYIIRLLPLLFFRKKIENNFINSFFTYVPYAVLGAMTFPDILYSTGNIISALCGLIVAVILSFFGRSMMVVSLSACGAVYIAEKLMMFF